MAHSVRPEALPLDVHPATATVTAQQKLPSTKHDLPTTSSRRHAVAPLLQPPYCRTQCCKLHPYCNPQHLPHCKWVEHLALVCKFHPQERTQTTGATCPPDVSDERLLGGPASARQRTALPKHTRLPYQARALRLPNAECSA